MRKIELRTSDQILQVALAKEKEARDFYEEQATNCHVEFVEPHGHSPWHHCTPEWGDIPAKRWRIHPRAKPVAFCCRGKKASRKTQK